jgi:glycosidase
MLRARLVLLSLLSTLTWACASAARPGPSPATVPAAAPPALQTWANGAVFYEVFVRSFQDSNGDGKGDLQGLISRLDYLNDGDPQTTGDLGIDAIWLMPVFASPSYHGYDTIDYERINPDYGSGEDFERLCAEAHRRGIRVVVDLVLNHTGAGHPWFVDSASSPRSRHRDWYVWSPVELAWGQPWNPAGRTWHAKNGAWYYGLFWAGMPDLNFRNPEVRAEAARLARLWLSRGVDGFRLDATRHLIETGPGETGQNDTPETHAFLKEFAAQVRAARPDAVLIGENWTETPRIAPYYGSTATVPGGDELPLNFDFPLARRLVEGVRDGDAARIGEKLLEIQRTYPPGATDVPFLTNHDQRRVASELGGDLGMLRAAAALLLTLPGSPFLYYGEEVGMENGPGGEDEAKRTPMAWDGTPLAGFTTGRPWHGFAPGRERANVAAQSRDPSSLLSRYRDLIRVRHASAALTRGDFRLLKAEGALLVFQRSAGAERVLVAQNLGTAAITANVPLAAVGADLLLGDGATLEAAGGEVRIALPARGGGIFRLR